MTDLQSTLGRIAALIAGGAPAAELFAAVVQELARVLGVPSIALLRYEPDGATTAVASASAPAFPAGGHWPTDGPSVPALVLESGRAARIEDHAGLESTIAARLRDAGMRSAAGAPIVGDGQVWGLICVASAEPLPAGIESGLRDFTDLVAVAIAVVEARARPRRLADQQAALRRVATLVAEGAPPGALFSAVAEEAARILDASASSVVRFEPDGTCLVVASLNDPAFPIGSRWPRDELDQAVHESGVGVPIVVDGRVWGMLTAGRREGREALPSFTGRYTGRIVLAHESTQEIETRLAAFTELVATAISKAQAHDDLRRLAEEQAALRRVATLVAEAAPPDEIFRAVAHEVATILGLPKVEMVRFEPDGTATVIGAYGDHPFPVGSNWTLDGPSVMANVYATGGPARIDDYGPLDGVIAEVARGASFASAIGAPIIVGGGIWGAIIAISTEPEPIPERSEARLSQFTELMATAVSNATARAELIASRARIVAAGDEARRRLERNLHDGTQQRLIALRLDLQRIRATLGSDDVEARAELEQAERDLESVLEEVRELSRGLHPAQLSRGGLGLALRALARRSPIRVDLDVEVEERPPVPIETAVYYVVSEALTNAIKHSHASAVSVAVGRDEGVVRARIADDGVGGAVAGGGSGLTGLADRVEALGGRLMLESPRERGTAISIELPIAAGAAR